MKNKLFIILLGLISILLLGLTNCKSENNPAEIDSTNVPDTGQTACYNNGGGGIGCPNPGQALAQDGSYTMNPISLSDNGDNTISDNNTGLVWQKQEGGSQFWPNAIDYCNNLTLGNATNWRLPTIYELTTILTLDASSPATDITKFTAATLTEYITSSMDPVLSTQVYGVDFTQGNIVFINNVNSRSVRCVRGDEYKTNEFVDTEAGMVVDVATALVWEQSDAATANWQGAIDYCENLTLGTKDDWRLPNYKELQSLVDYTKFNFAINVAFFPNPQIDYWSSTTDEVNPGNAWSLSFNNGFATSNLKTLGTQYARCVRGGY